jgi:hypothetical protein
MNSTLLSWGGFVLFGIVIVSLLAYLKATGLNASDSLHQQIKTYVAKYPELQPAYDRALSDRKLTIPEAKAIVNEGKALHKKGKAEPPPEVDQ